jgi:hypothetical protein
MNQNQAPAQSGGPPPKRQRQAGSSMGAPVQAQSDSDSVRKSLLSINRLQYLLEPDVSVAVSRTNVENHFSDSSYNPSGKAICILNTGSTFVNPTSTHLCFSVTNKSSSGVLDLGVGSACNFISRIALVSKSGDALEVIDRVNHLASVLTNYNKSRDWFASTGAAMGCKDPFKSTFGAGQTNFNEIKNLATNRFIVPMSEITGLFNFDRLLPPQVCAGLRVEITWADALEASKSAGDGKFEISDVVVVTDCVTLSDSAQRAIMEQATNGLEVVWKTYANQQNVLSGDNNIEIRKAVSRCLSVISKPHFNQSSVGEGNKDSMRCMENQLLRFNVKLGSLHYPNQPLSGSTPEEMVTQMYTFTNRGFGLDTRPSAMGSVSLADYQGVTKVGGLGVWCCNLERTNVMNLAGVPTNSSRSLLIQARVDLTNYLAPNTIQTVLLDTWLCHVKLLRAFLSNSSLSE